MKLVKYLPQGVFLLHILSHAGDLAAEQYLRPSVAMSEKEVLEWDWTVDEVVRISARFAWIDYEALRRDFPKMKDWSDEKIRQLLERHVFVIGKEQLKLWGFRSTEIPVSPDQTDLPTVYRQPYGGRSGVIVLKDGAEVLGYLDMKGMGYGRNSTKEVDKMIEEFIAAAPHEKDKLYDKDHSDGLMSLGEGIAELTRQRALQKSFDVSNVESSRGEKSVQTVDSYFILDLPFDILRSGGQRIPAGVYGRQAQFARGFRYDYVGENNAGAYADDHGNRQHDGFGAAIDMGAVLITDPKLKSTFYDGEIEGKEEKLGALRYDAQQTKPWRYGHEVARAYRAGDQQAVARHLAEMLAPIEKEWQAVNAKARGLAISSAVTHGLAALKRGYLIGASYGQPYMKRFNETQKISILDHVSHSLPANEALELVGKFITELAAESELPPPALLHAKEILAPLTQKAGRCVTEKAGECTASCAAHSP